MRVRLFVLGVLIVGLVVPAGAQPGGAPPAPPSEPAPVAAEVMPPPPPAEDPGAEAYRAGYAALVTGDLVTARAQLDAAAATALDPELRGAARELGRLAADLMARQARLSFGDAPIASDDGEDPADGRTTFIVWTTLSSLYAGAMLIDLTDTDDVRGGAALLLGSTAAGFLGSLFGSRGRSISGGMAEAYSSGILIGVANGALLADPLGADSSEAFEMAILSGLVVGGGAGLLYGDQVRPTRGQMSFVGTLATMGFATAGLGLLLTNPDVSSDTVLYTMTAGVDLGAAAGLVLGRDLTWSAGRARLVWLGALLGGVGGLGTALLIGGDDVGDDLGRATAGIALAGAWGGFALATHLTRGMRPDARYRTPPPALQLTTISVPRGAGVGVAGVF